MINILYLVYNNTLFNTLKNVVDGGKMIGSKETLEISKRQLFKAVHSDDIEEVTRILGLGININVQDDFKRTPIFLAVLRNNLPMVKKLAKFGANLEVKDNLEYTILSKVMLKGSSARKISQNERLTMIKTLIKYGAKPTTYSRGVLPIHIAIKEGRSLNIVKVLLTEDTANARDIFGWTPLHIAVWDNRRNVVELLIKYEHTDINQKDNEENTPLMLAASKGHVNIATLLFTNGADTNLKNVYGQTFFDLANLGEMKLLASHVTYLLSTDTESKNKPIVQLYPSNDHSSVEHQILENKPQFIESILSDLKSMCNASPNPDLSIPNTSGISQPRVLNLSSSGSSTSEASQLRMLDVSSPESDTSKISQHSTSAIPGLSKLSFSGPFTNRFQGALNIGSSRSIISETSQYEDISSPESSISEISQYEYISSPGYSISEASRRRDISPPISIISESTRSSIDSFSPSGSYAVDTKRRKLNHTLFSW